MLDDIKKTLWATADKLHANMDAAEYKHLVLGRIFVKYIFDTFGLCRVNLAKESLGNRACRSPYAGRIFPANE